MRPVTSRVLPRVVLVIVVAGLGLFIGLRTMSPGSSEPRNSGTAVSRFVEAEFRHNSDMPAELNDRLQFIHDMVRVPGEMTVEDVRSVLDVGGEGAESLWTWTGRLGDGTPPEIFHPYMGMAWSTGGLAERLLVGLPVSADGIRALYQRLADMARAPSPTLRLLAFHGLRDGGFYETHQGKALVDEMIRTETVDYVHHAMVGNMGRYEARKRQSAWGNAVRDAMGGP